MCFAARARSSDLALAVFQRRAVPTIRHGTLASLHRQKKRRASSRSSTCPSSSMTGFNVARATQFLRFPFNCTLWIFTVVHATYGSCRDLSPPTAPPSGYGASPPRVHPTWPMIPQMGWGRQEKEFQGWGDFLGGEAGADREECMTFASRCRTLSYKFIRL